MSKSNLRFSIKDPLNDGDTEFQTYGCRAANPDICKYCYLENICAFASANHICKAPSTKWKKYFHVLCEAKKDDRI